MPYNFLKYRRNWKQRCLHCGGKLKQKKELKPKTYKCQACGRKWGHLILKGYITKRSIYWKYRKLKHWFKK